MGVKSATLPSQVELSGETSVVLSAIKDLSNRMLSLEQKRKYSNPFINTRKNHKPGSIIVLENGDYEINGIRTSIGDTMYLSGEELGLLADASSNKITLKGKDGDTSSIPITVTNFADISTIPF